MTDYVIPPGSAVVTPNQMLDTLHALTREVHALRAPIERIERLADTTIPDHEARLRALEQRADGGEVATDVQDHENRIRGLERARWLIAGFAAGGGGAVGAVVTNLLGG